MRGDRWRTVGSNADRCACMGKQPATEVLLIRSGETDWDDAERLQGETDLPMSEAGRAAMTALSGTLADEPIETVYCGPDEASVATARAIASHTGARVRRLASLGEMRLGLWEGLREAELLERYPKAYQQWREDPTAVTPPEGDTLANVSDRIITAASKALERAGKGGRVAFVLRPLAMGILAGWLRGRGLSELWKTRESLEPIERLRVAVDDLLAREAAPSRENHSG